MARHSNKRPRGVPRAVQRNAGGQRVRELDMPAARVTWLLDLLAWARHSTLAPRIDMRGQRAAMPPVVLPPNGGKLVALDDVAAVIRLRSRHRAFSQIAGRYAPLVVAARDAGAALQIEIWDLAPPPAQTADDAQAQKLARLAVQLAEYMEATVAIHSRAEAVAQLAGVDFTALPEPLVQRNPLAWHGGLLAEAWS